jgi:hypothetical protein
MVVASARDRRPSLLALPQQGQQPLQLGVEVCLDPGDAFEVADVHGHAVHLVGDVRGVGGVLAAANRGSPMPGGRAATVVL